MRLFWLQVNVMSPLRAFHSQTLDSGGHFGHHRPLTSKGHLQAPWLFFFFFTQVHLIEDRPKNAATKSTDLRWRWYERCEWASPVLYASPLWFVKHLPDKSKWRRRASWTATHHKQKWKMDLHYENTFVVQKSHSLTQLNLMSDKKWPNKALRTHVSKLSTADDPSIRYFWGRCPIRYLAG